MKRNWLILAALVVAFCLVIPLQASTGYDTIRQLAAYVTTSVFGSGGTANYVPKFSGASTLVNGTIQDTGSAVTVGDGTDTVTINSSDWDIGATGDCTGLGAITSDGLATFGGLKMNITPHAQTEAATAATMYGNIHKVSGAYTITLPAAVIGMSGIFRASTAAALTLDCNGSDHFEAYDGTVAGAGKYLQSDATKNASISVYCESANTWIVFSQHGTWTAEL